MNIALLFQGINWRTTGCAVGYLLCNIASSVYPEFEAACGLLDKVFVAGGFISAADSTRINSIVQAVDHVAWKNGVDPATLLPTTSKG